MSLHILFSSGKHGAEVPRMYQGNSLNISGESEGFQNYKIICKEKKPILNSGQWGGVRVLRDWEMLDAKFFVLWDHMEV